MFSGETFCPLRRSCGSVGKTAPSFSCLSSKEKAFSSPDRAVVREFYLNLHWGHEASRMLLHHGE
ncbi:hypothetical protein HMPREF9141_2145 [Prevotella multiformis DSM 16608]|uniref:Uncharacterized protein n=1 Tax=Prevotella multiformis DSM 16608 TaxID=888743 RepID=F0F978_9BACT|nr:hypothetical protein HMPREF9141_2145 [Prevotella multiformis DSM 16608]